jgi:hypothetical protein
MRVAVKLSIAGAALAVTASAAFAGTVSMHTELAARLSGMGEHGIVNLTSNAKAKKLCWTFDLTTKGITAASIQVGQTSTVLVKLGKTYTKKGCTSASAMTLEHLETTPGKYWVFVDTKGHPGDLRGKIFAGMAHM